MAARQPRLALVREAARTARRRRITADPRSRYIAARSGGQRDSCRSSSRRDGVFLLALYPLFILGLSPERGALVEFLMGTVRQAMPEGLLGFFKAQGSLSNEAVLGRLGPAAVLAYINKESPPDRLIVSLDTEGARRWLGLRDGPEIRADLLGISIDGETCEIEVIEIKARTQPFEWNGTPPEALAQARMQVHEMERLLRQMFNLDPPDPFTPSRREILKRQVFLEALQQWEHLRFDHPETYESRLDNLNALFDGSLVVRVATRIFAVSPQGAEVPTERQISDTPVTLLGVDWFKRTLERTPGVTIDIPTPLLDELSDLFDDAVPGDAVPADGGTGIGEDSSPATHEEATRTELPPVLRTGWLW